jgi:hypothetical protein
MNASGREHHLERRGLNRLVTAAEASERRRPQASPRPNAVKELKSEHGQHGEEVHERAEVKRAGLPHGSNLGREGRSHAVRGRIETEGTQRRC